MKELRIAELRASDPAGSAALQLTGRPIVYDQPTVIHETFGDYTEVIKRGALDHADLSDIRLLYNHDLSKIPLARTPKTMQLRSDPAGLTIDATLPETEDGRSVYQAVKRGDLSGMSFAFKVPTDGSQFDTKTNTRTITKIEKVYECSIVPFPAYAQTSVEARSAIQGSRERDQIKIKINQLLLRGL